MALWVLGAAYGQDEKFSTYPTTDMKLRTSSWCHRHTNVKLSWSQSMDPWTERQYILMLLPMSIEPWAAAKKALD